MNNISGETKIPFLTVTELENNIDKEITINACVNKIKNTGSFSFVYLRTGNMLLQGIYIADKCKDTLDNIGMGVYVRAKGIVKKEERAEYGCEILLTSITPLSFPKEKYPLNVADKTLAATLEVNMDNRTVALRHPTKKAVLKICEGVVRGFRDFMLDEGFTEIHTPKISAFAPENEKNAIRLKYYGNDAFLTQSPQLYKQSAVAFFDRVFEVGAVYYAGKHNSARHLSEYVSLDFELGFIEDIEDVMGFLTAAIRQIISTLDKKYQNELNIIDATLPDITSIPSITFDEAMQKLNKDYEQSDLDPTDEVRLCEGCDFLFVTDIPKQPYYNKRGFVLLFRGMEVAQGGERFCDYDEQLARLGEENEFLNLHRYGVPPHGGCGIGLERFVMKLLGLENIREASLFPRDMHHCGM